MMNVSGLDLLLYPVKITSDDMNVNCSLWNFFLPLYQNIVKKSCSLAFSTSRH